MPLPWDAFLARYGPMARAIASAHVRPPATAEDVVQEAALALHRTIAREPERFASGEQARNYFLRTVQNLALKSRRDAPREEPLQDDPPRLEEPVDGELTARRRLLGRLLLELEPDARELLVRRYLRRETLASIAADSGTPLSTLHDRERALLAALRRRWNQLDPEGLR